jgi:hypothetical protein
VLVFFDEQPIAVKAYGGRRYTSAKRLILDRMQKTRGFFSLFAAYEVNSGRRRWAFYSGKSSAYICRFMEQIRRWYRTRSASENWNHAAACDSPSPAGRREGAASPRRAAS